MSPHSNPEFASLLPRPFFLASDEGEITVAQCSKCEAETPLHLSETPICARCDDEQSRKRGPLSEAQSSKANQTTSASSDRVSAQPAVPSGGLTSTDPTAIYESAKPALPKLRQFVSPVERADSHGPSASPGAAKPQRLRNVSTLVTEISEHRNC